MGLSAADSVSDSELRCWDDPNLFLVGAGAFPTIATPNPTLTLSALAFRAARAIEGSL
jgi:choline dehydrogenase-like flavoprotein